MDVAVVGAGRAGTAVGALLARAGHRIVATSGRAETERRVRRFLPGVPVLDAPAAAGAADLIVIGTPDDAIHETAVAIASAPLRSGAWVVHLSGALGLDALEPVVRAGARRLAIHPLQTFPDVETAIARIPGCSIGVTAEDAEGAALGERLAREVGGVPFPLADERRPLYHAAAVFASNYLVTTSAIAEVLLSAAGVPDPAFALSPLRRASLENVERLGAAAALTGPAARGDAGTVRRNLEALKQDAPELIGAYVAMARAALDVARRDGRVSPDARVAVEDVLTAWS